MKIKDVANVCIVDMSEEAISTADIMKLEELFEKKALKRRIGINLKNVKYINNNFLDCLRRCNYKQKIALFNLDTDVYLSLFVSNMSYYVELYLNEYDFYYERNQIVRRRLKVVNRVA